MPDAIAIVGRLGALMLLLAALGSAPAAAAVVDLKVTQRVSLLDGRRSVTPAPTKRSPAS